jgi:hypothetical protein
LPVKPGYAVKPTFDSLSILELLSLLAKQAEKNESQIVLLLDEIQEYFVL